MRRSTSIVAALAVLVVIGVIAWMLRSESAPIVDAPVRRAAARHVADDASDANTQAPMTPAAASGEPTRTVLAATAAEIDKATRPPAIVRGRFVRPDGTPAGAASARLHGSPANDERLAEFGAPNFWVDPTGATDADGNLELAFDPPEAFSFELTVELAGQAPVSQRWFNLEPSSVTDVGTVTLPWGCVVEGEVVDARGKPMLLPWSVQIEANHKATTGGSSGTRVFAKLDAAHATFRIEGVPEGLSRVRASSEVTGPLKSELIGAHRDRTEHVHFVYKGTDLARALTLFTSNELLRIFDAVDPEKVLLTGHPNGPIEGTRYRPARTRLQWTDLPDASYTIDIDDPNFVRWTKTGLKPGDCVTANLVGSCSVGLTVIDPRTGAAVDAYRLRVRYRDEPDVPVEMTLREAREPAPPRGLYVGIVPGDVALVVDAEGFAATESVLGPLEPRTTRSVTITLRSDSAN